MKMNELVERILEGYSLNEVIEINDYIPIEDKKNIALEVLKKSMTNDNGYMQIDQFKKHVYFMIAMMREYAGIEFDQDFYVMMCEYDELCEYGIVDYVIEVVGKDYNRLEQIFDLMEKEFVAQNSIEAQIAKMANVVINSFGTLTSVIEEKVKDVDLSKIIPEGADIDQLMNVFKELK